MREAVEIGIDEMERNFYRTNVPASVYIAFVDMVRSITHSARERRRWTGKHAEAAVRAQESLGSFAILRGHHHTEWAEAIMRTYKKRARPPNTEKTKKKVRDKSALEMSVYLVEECWRFFEKIWAVRNKILHSTDGYAAQAATSEWTRRLLRYKFKQNELLHYCDRHHVDYPVEVILAWNRKRKRNLLRILDKFHKIYLKDIRLEAEGQRKLDDYSEFFIIPEREDGD